MAENCNKNDKNIISNFPIIKYETALFNQINIISFCFFLKHFFIFKYYLIKYINNSFLICVNKYIYICMYKIYIFSISAVVTIITKKLHQQ